MDVLPRPVCPLNIRRSDFDKDFVFGAATSALQIEGGATEDGKALSIWDTFARKPGKIDDGSDPSVACDSYQRYKEDVKLLKKLGFDSYRFSISWPRVLPGGRKSAGGVNREGIQYYNNLIDELVANGIQPFVTLFHWDLPQALENEYDGFLDRRIIDDFGEFAELCFITFGDRVKNWITLNEPWTFAYYGYVAGQHAPGRGSENGDPGKEPYQVVHNMLLAHAEAVRLYRQRFQAVQGGKIGITLVADGHEPLTPSALNKEAADRAFDFLIGWFMEPLTSGSYPKTMRDRAASRLPSFSVDEAKKVNGSYDFIGLNYYTTRYASHTSSLTAKNPSYDTDQAVTTQAKDLCDKPLGELLPSKSVDYSVYPEGIYKVLWRVKSKYNDPIIYITENGVWEEDNPSLTISEACKDDIRTRYYQDHLKYLHAAIHCAGVKVKGYFAWSLLDNFEFNMGYMVRYGITYVDIKGNQARSPKSSALWFKEFLDEKNVDHPDPNGMCCFPSKRALEVVDGESAKKKAFKR